MNRHCAPCMNPQDQVKFLASHHRKPLIKPWKKLLSHWTWSLIQSISCRDIQQVSSIAQIRLQQA